MTIPLDVSPELMALGYVQKQMPPKSLSHSSGFRVSGLASSRKQEIVYEMLPAFYCRCKVQGHNSRTYHTIKPTTGDILRIQKKDPTSGEELKENHNQVIDDEQPIVEQKEPKNKLDAGGPSLSYQEIKLVMDSGIGDSQGDEIVLVQDPQLATVVSNALINDSHPLPRVVEAKIEIMGEEARDLQNAIVVPAEEDSPSMDDLCLEGTSMSDPKPELPSEVLPQKKDYHTEFEGYVAKKKIQ